MNRIVFLIVLYSSSVVVGLAQQIGLNVGKHLPKLGDTLLLVEIPHKPIVIATGTDCIWDFSNLVTDSIALDAYYYTSTNDSMRITQHLMHTHHLYELEVDTLWYVGLENASISINYTRKRKAMVFPFAFGDSLVCEFLGIGKYTHKKTYPIVGKSRVCAEAWGKLILPNLTLDTTLLIRSTHTYKNHLEDTTSHLMEDIFQWYHPSYRYPVFEVAHKYIDHQSSNPTIAYAFYHIPTDDSIWSNDSEDIPTTNGKEITFVEIDSILTDIRFYPNPVHDNLTITYRQKQPAEVFFSIHYNDGFCVYQSPIRSQGEGDYSEYIPMSTMPIGAYVVYIHVDDKVVSSSILKH